MSRMTVTEFSRLKKNDMPVIAQLLTSLSLNSINTPSNKAGMYGNYVTMWLELKLTGKLKHIEYLKRRGRLRGRKGKIIKQAISQYQTLQLLRKVIVPNKDFMRIVLVRDTHFELENTFQWVDVQFVRQAVVTLEQQLLLIGVRKKDVIFEHRVQTETLSGIIDIFDPVTQTVVEIKTCRVLPKEAFIQVSAYAHMVKAKRAYIFNTVDCGVWKVIPIVAREGEKWISK